MINVKHIKDTEYEITWDENDSLEKQLNHWTEEDFIKCLRDACEELKGDTK